METPKQDHGTVTALPWSFVVPFTNDVLPDLFETSVDRLRERIAIECGGKWLTFAELDAAANRWAGWLRQRGVRRGMRVAFWLPRAIEVHAVLLGVLKSGAAYVPLDPEYPPDRVQFILENSGAAALVTTERLAAGLSGLSGGVSLHIVERVRDDVAAQSAMRLTREETGLTADDEAYVIYTSGSTGRPKGVQMSHRNVVHLVRVEGELFQVRETDRVFQGFSLAFDASVEEVWLAYHSGGTLVIGTSEMIRSGPELSKLLAEARISILSCVPTLLLMMGSEVSTVRLLIVGGEACPAQLIQQWANGSRRMFNTYGPTEATVIATWTECHRDQPVTIGRALPGYSAVIVDEQMRAVATGQEGELLLGGIGLSSGYVGLPELTREKFIPDPFAKSDESRLYRTGDLCRFNADGDIEFLGRIDGQVKLHGYRVELSEIEAVLVDHESVRAAAVTVREDVPGVKQLVAYIVPREGAVVDEDALKGFARNRLPPYMVPALIETLSELPTLSSGKVDRRSLPVPRPREAAVVNDEGFTPSEAALLAVWRRLFAPQTVSVSDNFFLDLGGDSVSAAGMISELRTRPEFREASMVEIYLHPTIRELAPRLSRDATDVRTDAIREGEAPAESASRTAARQEPRPHVANEPLTSSAKFTICGVVQLLGLYVVMGLAGAQWLAPYLTYSYLHDSEYSMVESLAGAVVALVTLYPVLVIVVVAVKWLCLGRVKAGSYPLWGWFYMRWWFVRGVESVIPINYLVGTPLLNFYCRLMGVRIGTAVHLGSESFGAYDLVTVGDATAISVDSTMLGYSVSDGHLHLGSITIGRGCYVGARTLLRENVRIEDGGRLEDLSMLPSGSVIASGETWRGSPASRCGTGRVVPNDLRRHHGTPVRRFWFGFAQAIGVVIVPVLIVASLLPGMALMHHLNAADEYYWYLLLSPLVGLSFVLLLATQITLLKWLIVGRVRAGTYPLYGGFSLRKWYVDELLDLSVDVLGPLYSTLYLTPWYRALGAKLGRFAEVSTASFISPDLLTLGDGSFIADIVSLGAARVEDGQITVDHVKIGKQAFVRNSALLPPGTVLGDDSLIGCLSVPPEGRDAVPAGSSWVGSPAMLLPHRSINTSFAVETTYSPTRRLIALRLFIELWRVILPSAGFLCTASLMFSAVSILRDEIDEWLLWLLFPLLYSASCLIFVPLVVVMKWLVMGRYRLLERPLWSGFVWRTELVTALHDYFAGPLLLDALRGTPFLAWYFRLMGTKIGRRVFLDTVQISEFDLVTIGDDAQLNSDATLQTHLFEDRVMKMSHVRIGPRCVVGEESLVLYDTTMQAGSTLGGLSLLMKGETLPPDTHWEGTPARKAQQG